MTDRLDAIEAGLRDGRYDCRVPGDTDDVRWLVGEVRRLRETQFCGYCGWQKAHSSWADLQAHIRECKQHQLRQAESDLAALRERHAEAVEAAWREGALMILDCPFTSEDLDRMWRKSEARRQVGEGR